MTDIVKRKPNALAWAQAGQYTFETWAEIGREIKSQAETIQWAIGDWYVYGWDRWDTRITEVVGELEYDHRTIANIVSVASRVPFARRRETLSWSHHEAVASQPPDEQDRLLELAERDGLSVHKLRAVVRDLQAPTAPPEIESKTTKYEITTERQRQIAEKARERVGNAAGMCSALAQAPDHLRFDRAVAAATPGEIAGWLSAFRGARTAIKDLERKIEEARR